MSTGKVFLESVIQRMLSAKALADKSFDQLETEDFHFAFNEESNSIAVIIQHMSGNMLSRWTNFLQEDGEKSWRNRDAEFNDRHLSKQQLLGVWEEGWTCFLNALRSMNEEDLLKTVYIRSESMTALDAIIRQLIHYPSHIGQIVYIARMIRGKDWQSLSIPRNQSGLFNENMKKQHKG